MLAKVVHSALLPAKGASTKDNVIKSTNTILTENLEKQFSKVICQSEMDFIFPAPEITQS